jgi:hypothetical protein
VDVNKEGLAVPTMLDMIKKGDVGNEPRLDKTHQEEGEDGRETKKVKLNKAKATDQTDCDGDIIRSVQKTGNSREEEKAKKVTGDACDNEDAGGDEDDDGENFEDRDTKWVSGDEIKNIREEEAGLEDAFENPFTVHCSLFTVHWLFEYFMTNNKYKCNACIYLCLCGSLLESVQEGKGEIRYHFRQHSVCLQK